MIVKERGMVAIVESLARLFSRPRLDLRHDLPRLDAPISQLCTHARIESATYQHWLSRMKEAPRRHRKLWEFAYILQVLSEQDMLRPGRRGLGFGVGTEPLPALMASCGVAVHATDLELEQAKLEGWVATNQHLAALEELNARQICDDESFRRLVSFEPIDMNAIPSRLRDFDFTWSSCALEHLGSLEHGLRFIDASLDTLKPGGIAVHTTEFNCSSDRKTVRRGETVIYRRRDIVGFLEGLTHKGYRTALTLAVAGDPLDQHVDVPPYSAYDHLRLQLYGYVTTSIGMVIHKPEHPA
jgi:2-polyprenyl-3-methyl-5-hydroxy-6-metoxy-1,4-benzoquinol methylase